LNCVNVSSYTFAQITIQSPNFWVNNGNNKNIALRSCRLGLKMPASKLKAARFYAFLSIGAAVSTIALKFGAYKLTGSIGLFSDALESLVNLVAAIATLYAITFATKPANARYSFGYSKVEYLSSALEGVMILFAAIGICIASVDRILHPQSIEQVGSGIIISTIAALINGRVAIALMGAGKRLRSIALKSDGRHLLTDVWTSVGVVVGLVAANLTGWQILDPLIAILVAINILKEGLHILQETTAGLLDAALPKKEQMIIQKVLRRYQNTGVCYQRLKTRLAGSQRFVSVNILVPGNWSVEQGHYFCDVIEIAIANALPGTHTTTHLEPLRSTS
jgi:cation diffusion facilitator family transporter